MYNPNDFLDKSLFIINSNRRKSNALKNHFLKNILNNEYISQFLGYLSELEYDLETLHNYISDFQLLNNNMIENLHEINIKENNYHNEINRLKEALRRANDEIHNLRKQNDYINTRNKEKLFDEKFFINIEEEKNNMNNTDNKLNYFRNYLESQPYHTFRKNFNSIRFNNNNEDIIQDKYRRLTYYRDLRNNDKTKNNDSIRKSKATIKTIRKNSNKSDKSNHKDNIFNKDKSQSSNKIKNNIKNEINDNNCNICTKKDIIKNKNEIKNNNKNISKNVDFESHNNSKDMNINNNNIKFGNNEDIKDLIKQNSEMNENNNSNSNSNIIDLNNNQSNQTFGKIISHNNSITSPINRINQINFNQSIYPTPRASYSSYDFKKKTNSIIFSKRMQNYIHNQNLKKRFDEISKESSDNKLNRINNIINTITNDKDKLNELKLMFGNSIEAQILNGDLSYVYLNKIENFLYDMEESKSILSLSKRFQIQNNSSKKNKISNDNNDNDNNFRTGRFIRKKLTDKNYNKNNVRRWNTNKNFFDKNKRNKY